MAPTSRVCGRPRAGRVAKMSKYPDNPQWCQNHDRPKAIMSRAEWGEAARSGHLTVEHVLLRIRDMLDFEFGNGEIEGLDEDGFLRALVADAMHFEGGVTVRLHCNDHPPPHVHVEFRSLPGEDFRVLIDTGELVGADVPSGWAKRMRRVSALVLDHRDLLLGRWEEMQLAQKPSS